MLGSTRVVTDQNQAVKARHDYLPFGEEIASDKGGRSGVAGYTAADSTRQQFTSKERDIESGMDYFLARYYSAAQGRFTSADMPIVGQDADNPQTWNLFAYTSNNPIIRHDPDGRRWFYRKENGKVVDVQWVNPNEDGTYTSPGDEWIEFVPKNEYDVLISYNKRHTVAYLFWEKKDGSPGYGSLSTGAVRDATIAIVVELLTEKGFNRIITHAFDIWEKYLAKKAARVVKEVIDETLKKKADDLIPGSLKRSRSYHSDLGGKTKEEILKMEKGGDPRAAQMKKLIEQSERLLEKTKGKHR
jgi:RHS repeat-associated protein